MLMTESDLKLDPEIGQEYLNIVKGWDEFEIASGGTGGPSDLWFAQSEGIRFRSRREILERLEAFRGIVPNDVKEGRSLIRRVEGLIAFGENKEGRITPLKRYIELTLGISPVPHSDSDIARVSQEFGKLLSDETGIHHNETGWRLLKSDIAPLSREEVEAATQETKRKLTPILLEIIGKDLPTDDFEARLVTANAPWVSRIYGGPEKYLYEVNEHERNRSRLFKGSGEQLSYHEDFHLFQALAFRANIQQGILGRSYGVTTIPGVEQLPMEGMAQAWPLYIPEVREMMSPFGKLALEYSYLYDLVYSNAVLRKANDEIFSDNNIVEFVREHLPGETPDRILYMISIRRLPRYKSYAYAYYGNHLFREWLKKITDANKRREAVGFILNTPATYDEVEEKFTQLAAAA